MVGVDVRLQNPLDLQVLWSTSAPLPLSKTALPDCVGQVRSGLTAGGRWIRTSGSAPAATPLTDRGVKPQATAAGCHFGAILPQGATLMMARLVSFSRNWRER